VHGENGVILGAAGLVLYELFEPLPRVSVRTERRLSGDSVASGAQH
jgi:hypothetical protein